MQPYDKHTSWVKSPWNYVNFLLEYHLKSLDLELGKMYEPCNSFLAKVRKSQETWVLQSQRESQETLLKKLGWNPEGMSHTFCRIHYGKILFSNSKLTKYIKKNRNVYISSNPSVWSFSGTAHTQQKRKGLPCMFSTNLSRSELPSLI